MAQFIPVVSKFINCLINAHLFNKALLLKIFLTCVAAVELYRIDVSGLSLTRIQRVLKFDISYVCVAHLYAIFYFILTIQKHRFSFLLY